MDQITQVCYRALPLFFLQWADECDEYIWGGGAGGVMWDINIHNILQNMKYS